eukprot:ANDGO_05367.mRNA.1 Shk1 kinase-binding protein 15
MKSSYCVCGSYSGRLYGIQIAVDEDPESESPIVFKPSFSSSLLNMPVQHVSMGDRYLVSSSGDEKLAFFDLRKMVDEGMTIHQSGSVVNVSFADPQHFVTSSTSGKLCIWSTRNFDVLLDKMADRKGLFAHAAHPSGKAVFTLGSDWTLKLWETQHMKAVSGITLDRKHFSPVQGCDAFLFTKDGNFLLTVQFSVIHVFDVMNAQEKNIVDVRHKVTCVYPVSGTLVLIGTERSGIMLFDIAKLVKDESTDVEPLVRFTDAPARIKGIGLVHDNHVLVCGCSDGTVLAYPFPVEEFEDGDFTTSSIAPVASYAISGRITAMAAGDVEKTPEQVEREIQKEKELKEEKAEIRREIIKTFRNMKKSSNEDGCAFNPKSFSELPPKQTIVIQTEEAVKRKDKVARKKAKAVALAAPVPKDFKKDVEDDIRLEETLSKERSNSFGQKGKGGKPKYDASRKRPERSETPAKKTDDERRAHQPKKSKR